MMTTLDGTDAAKLAKLLGMLGSDHAGERDAAGLAAHRLITSRGLTWDGILSPPPVRPPKLGQPWRGWRDTVERCLQQPGSLRRWEVEFLSGLRHYQNPSRKQKEVLRGIVERVLGAGVAP